LLQRSWRSSGNLFRTRNHGRAEIGACLYDNSTSTFVQSQKNERTTLMRKVKELALRLWRGEVGPTESVLLMGLVALALVAV
jgi:hypothetical protein